MLARTGRSQVPGLRASSSQARRRTRGQRGGNAGCGASAFASRAAPPPRSWGPRERTQITRAIPREIATHPFFFFFFPRHFASTSFCFVLFCFGGQSGVRKSKHKTNPEGIGGGGGCAGARPGREERGPACVLRPRALGPAWPGWAVSCCTGRR